MADPLVCALLDDAGSMDVDYIERQLDTLELDPSDVMAVYRERGFLTLDTNTFIDCMQELVIQKANRLIEVAREDEDEDDPSTILPSEYGELEYDRHYTTFINCLDSHLDAKEDEIKEDFGEKLGQKIIDLLNEW